jgi:type IV secretion system protein VirB11
MLGASDNRWTDTSACAVAGQVGRAPARDLEREQERERDRERAPAAVPGRDTALQAYLTPLRALLDAPDVTELCINRPGEVFVEQNGHWHRHELPALTFTHLQAFSRALATYTGQHIDEQQPLLSATLPVRGVEVNPGGLSGGERVQVVGPPAVEADTLAVCIRKPSRAEVSLAQLGQTWKSAHPGQSALSAHSGRHLATSQPTAGKHPPAGLFSRTLRRVRHHAQQLDPLDAELLELLDRGEVQSFLAKAVRARRTIVVAGRTGAGKTTLMRALLAEIDPQERLITIEDAAELFMPRHPNSLKLYFSRAEQAASNPGVQLSASTLLQACLRLRPDRILLAELRGHEAFDFLRLAASGHPGSLTSVHAGSAALAFDQIALMARQSPAGAGLTLPELHTLAHSLVDIVVHMDVDAHGRYVSDIHFDPHARLRQLATAAPQLQRAAASVAAAAADSGSRS